GSPRQQAWGRILANSREWPGERMPATAEVRSTCAWLPRAAAYAPDRGVALQCRAWNRGRVAIGIILPGSACAGRNAERVDYPQYSKVGGAAGGGLGSLPPR